jgi:hypothetical protein
MPENVRNRQTLDATLAIYASNRIEYTETIRLWTERLAVKPRFAPSGKYNLFGEPAGGGPSSYISQSDRCFDDDKPVRERERASQLTT